ncbi:MAG: type II CRISPR-associated endonuclease Cas1 [Propionibacteriaceae bacterium]|nr:type II CRISPR-associated endonuclease Cas1 [Propionibacteriaceae bacterium]
MSSPWRILDCSQAEGHIRTKRGQLIVTISDEFNQTDTTVPLADIQMLILGPRISLGASTVQVLSREEVSVLFTDWRGVPLGAGFGWPTHSRVAARHLAQAALSLPRRKNAWGRIVIAKVTAQAKALDHFGHHRTARNLLKLSREVRSGDPTNIEARAARTYWAKLMPPMESRSPRRRNGINALLDYGYTILRGHGIRAVLAAGLSPPLGLFHRGRGNYFNLVDDLIEPFRPVIDVAAFSLDRDDTLNSPQVKRVLVTAPSQRYASGGESSVTCLERLAQHLGMYIEGEISRLDVPSWEGPEEPASGPNPS